MSENEPFSAEDIGLALQRIRANLDKERREQFTVFGVDPNCLWPASRIFHEQSTLGPAWQPVLSATEVEALTHNGNYKRYLNADRIPLPEITQFDASLCQTIKNRRSQSEFSDRPVDSHILSALLGFGAGVTSGNSFQRRAAPSGGALYPIETYVLAFDVTGVPAGLYHYFAAEHLLEVVQASISAQSLHAFLPPGLAAGRPKLMLVLTAVFERTQSKYLERGYRFALLEAGHIAQNMLLVATSLELSAVPVGGFWDEPLNDLLGVKPNEEAAIYSMLFGYPVDSEDGYV